MTTPEQISELLALAEKATPRPWYCTTTGAGIPCVNYSQPDDYHGLPVCIEGMRKGNIPYIAAACNLAPALAREVERLRAEVESLKEELRDTRYSYHTDEREFSA
ncbi:hypothetical protein LJC15_04200 [Desulfovibrio sp. OttesenSCG-928-G11]|nr:hypothetical protein [Desulfovibrio sp. OttesenSCG-928-G11]